MECRGWPRDVMATLVWVSLTLVALCGRCHTLANYKDVLVDAAGADASSRAVLGDQEEHQPRGQLEHLRAGLGPPASAWYFSLKTSKGYCGLLPLGDGAFAISCNNKNPMYASGQFAVLLDGGTTSATAAAVAAATADDASGTRSALGAGEAGRAAAAGSAAAAGVKHSPGATAASGSGGVGGPSDDPTSVTVLSGQAVRLVARAVGSCATPPPPIPPAPSQQAAVYARSRAAGVAPLGSRQRAAASRWWALRGAVIHGTCRLLQRLAATCGLSSSWLPSCDGFLSTHQGAVAGAADAGAEHGRGGVESLDSSSSSSSSSGGSSGGGEGMRVRGGMRSWVGARDVAPAAVACALGQPAAGTFRVFKTSLKAGDGLDLAKEWIYLQEGDKFCTMADLPGLPAVVSCHLDSPGWTGYQFQLQPLARPATRFKSLLTGSDCGVRQPQQPPPHDIECGAGQQGGREARVDLVLQTPGSALAAGVVVGLYTFVPGLVGAVVQQCCTQAASPHILLCEEPVLNATAVPNDCWFTLYDVKKDVRTADAGGAGDDTAGGRGSVGDSGADASSAGARGGAGSVSTGKELAGAAGSPGATWRTLLERFLLAMQASMSPVELDPQFGDANLAVYGESGGRQGGGLKRWRWRQGGDEGQLQLEEGGRSDKGVLRWDLGPDPDVRPDPLPWQYGRLTVEDAQALGADGGSSENGVLVPQEGAAGPIGAGMHERAGGAGAGAGGVQAAAPLCNGCLVMMVSKAYGRYCSVSLDGTLLCVSAQASNASRNLFFLDMGADPWAI